MAYRAHVDEGAGRAVRAGRRTRIRDRAADRDRHQSRAAASGASADRYPGAVRRQPAAARLSRSAGRRAAAPEPANARWIDYPGGIRQVGHDGAGFAWDNEAPRHDVLHPSLPPRRPSGHQRRMARIHGGRRLSHGRAVARRRLGNGQPRGLGGAALLGAARRRSGSRCRSKACSPSIRAAPVTHVSYFEADAFARWAGKRLPTEFEWEIAAQDLPVAGNDARDPGAAAAACGSRHRRRAAADVRRRVGMDAERLPALSGLPSAGRRARRIQRQVHGQPAGAARRLVRDAAGPHARHLPQLLLSRTSAGSSWACVSRRRSPDVEPESCAGAESVRPADETILPTPSSTGCRSRSKTLPCRFFYDARGSELFEEITRLPEYYPTRTETAILRDACRRDGRRRARRRRAGRVRLRLEPEDRAPARAAAAARRLRSHRRVATARSRTQARGWQRAFPSLDVRPIVGDFSRSCRSAGRSCRHGTRPASFPARPSAT